MLEVRGSIRRAAALVPSTEARLPRGHVSKRAVLLLAVVYLAQSMTSLGADSPPETRVPSVPVPLSGGPIVDGVRPTGRPVSRCQAQKLRSVSIEVKSLFECHANGAFIGRPADQACLAAGRAALAERFIAAEAGDCATVDDATTLEEAIDGSVARIAALLRHSGRSKYDGSRLKEIGSAAQLLFEGFADQREAPNDEKLDGVDCQFWTRLEHQLSRTNPPSGCHAVAARKITDEVRSLIGTVMQQLWPLSASGVTFNPLPGFTLDGQLLALGGPVELTNFDPRGMQMEPPGGARIDITRDLAPGGKLSVWIRNRRPYSELLSTSALTVAGTDGTVVRYRDRDNYSDVATTVVYVLHRQYMYKFILTYHTADPHEKDFTAAFDALLASVRFDVRTSNLERRGQPSASQA